MTITPDMILAGEAVLKPYISDEKVSIAALALQIYGAMTDAQPGKKKRIARSDEPEGFAEFYTAFPRNIGRRGAANSYRAALTRSSAEIILAGAKRYAQAMKAAGTEPQYIKHPQTWLNNDCWADDLGTLKLVESGVFQDCSVDGWVTRIEIWMGKTSQPARTWNPSWGANPIDPACKIPQAAKDLYRKRYPKTGTGGQ